MNNVIKISKRFASVPIRNVAEGLNVGGFSSISPRGKIWSLKHQGQSYNFVRDDDGTPLSYLDVVIVGDAPYTSKIFFGGEFNEDSAGAPICAAVKGDKPDPGVSMPQAKTCAVCPHNEWKTLPTGRRGKECQDHKRLAVLLMPKMTTKMLGSPLKEPVYLKITPASLRAFKTYGDYLMHQGLPACGVVTRVSFSPDKLFQMDFKATEALSDDAADIVLPWLSSPQTMQITGETVSAPALPAPDEEEVAPGGGSNDLLEAFGMKPDLNETELPKRGGRPMGSKNRPKQIEAQVLGAQALEPQEEAEPTPAQTPEDKPATGYEESDSELDGALTKLLGRKVQDMLK